MGSARAANCITWPDIYQEYNDDMFMRSFVLGMQSISIKFIFAANRRP